MIVQKVYARQLRTYFLSMDRLGTAYTEEPKIMNQNLAKDYKSLLIQNIISEKYSSMYRPLSERYEDWKEQHGGESGFWKLWGSLVASIAVRGTPKGFVVEIPRTAMPAKTSSMGKKTKITPIWMYAFYGEFGRRAGGFIPNGQPPRPIFRLSAEEFRLKFLDKRRNDTFDKITRAW